MEELGESVREWIRKEVDDWDSEAMVSARFKAFSGQRSDWEPRYLFWRDLIIKIARHLHIFIIRPSEVSRSVGFIYRRRSLSDCCFFLKVKNVWFNHGGLTPLCIDRVLLEMYNAGDILCSNDVVDPKSGQLTRLLHKVKHLLPLSKSPIPSQDDFLISTLLEEKSVQVIKLLSDHHWTSSCIVTMSKFQVICGGPKEAYAVLSHLSKCGKVKYLAITRKDLIEGVKVSLSSKTVSGTTSPDYDVLHLTWTAEKLQLQLDMIDQRCDKSKLSALASLKSGNKISALRQARELKMASENREKCYALLRRVEEVLRTIADAEDSREVFEAIQSGTKAMKDNKITMEQVQLCLDELDETINSQKQVEKVIGSISSYAEFDEDIEDELEKLQLEQCRESSKTVADGMAGEHEITETAKSLSKALSDVKLTETPNISKGLELELELELESS